MGGVVAVAMEGVGVEVWERRPLAPSGGDGSEAEQVNGHHAKLVVIILARLARLI
jgi:hypothetical protein